MDFQMEIDSPVAKGKNKRPATDGTPPATSEEMIDTNHGQPQVHRNHIHRRRNVAIAIWGPEVAATPQTAGVYPAPPAGAALSAPAPPFNIYKALLRHPNLFFQFALRLPYPSIIHLYAIDKEFHYRLNQYSVSLMHDYVKYHVPIAGPIFSWALYPELCISDPMLRPMDGREWLARDVPSFRWIGMVIWRERVVHAILTCLGIEGHRVPAGTEASLMKFWSVMEMKSTSIRAAFLADTSIWSDGDLLNVQLLLVKLDMRFAEPIRGSGACALSHMLLCQKSLSTLWKVLIGNLKLDYDDATDILVRTYLTSDLDTEHQAWLGDEVDNGVPEEEWGLMYREGWHVDGARMEPAIDMLITEGVRRGLGIQQYLLDFVMFGYMDDRDGKNMPVPRRWRGDRVVVTPEEGWPRVDEQESLVEKMRERFGGRVKPNVSGDEMDTSA